MSGPYPKRTDPVATECYTVTAEASPEGVAGALRMVADIIEDEALCLIGIWSTGFGEAWEATVQVVVERTEP